MEIAILLADRTYPEVAEKSKDIKDLYIDFFAKENRELHFFSVREGIFPTREYSHYVITGSPASAYDQENWILQLKDLIQKNRQKKLLGICFGHQIIAEALGGKVEKSSHGWNLGLCSLGIKKFPQWMISQPEKVHMIFNHQDQVTRLPEGAELLAGDNQVSAQMFSIGENVLAMQGHPEFTQEYQVALMHRIHHVIGSQEIIAEAEQSYQKNTADNQLFQQWVNCFLEQ